MEFKKDHSEYYGGSIAWTDSSNILIDTVSISDDYATHKGGAIYLNNVEGTVKNSNFTNTRTYGSYGGALYVNGNVTIEDCTFAQCSSLNNLGTAVHLDGGNSSIVTSNFSTLNPILIENHTGVHLTKNNVENS